MSTTVVPKSETATALFAPLHSFSIQDEEHGLRIYIASSTENVEKVEHLVRFIKEETLHSITFDWTESFRNAGSVRESPEISEARIEQAARADMAGVATCDLFILLWHPAVYGAMAEFGMAMVLNKCAWVVSDDAVKYSVFFRCPGNHVQFKNVDQCYKDLRVADRFAHLHHIRSSA